MAKVPKRMPLATVGQTPALACSPCALFDTCGGLCVKEAVWDCFEVCREQCVPEDCDWVCPHKPDFWERVMEAGGLREPSHYRLSGVSELHLPLYVPQVIHGKRRERPLDSRLVAVPTFSALTGGGERYGEGLDSGSILRERFRISPSAQVLLLSVAPDRQLERYWRWRIPAHAPARLAGLGAFGVTLPNYSIFLNAPRSHWLFNRARMLRVGEELSAAGLPVVPHLNASAPADWKFWEQLLRANPSVAYVSKELQTGLTRLDRGRAAIGELARLQDRVGRDLHPIIVGGTRFLDDLLGKFRRFTLVDSNPFMVTMHRRRYERRDQHIRRVAHPTAIGAPLDDLLEQNLRVYEEWLYDRAGMRLGKLEETVRPPYQGYVEGLEEWEHVDELIHS